jgi:hypothetical protein
VKVGRVVRNQLTSSDIEKKTIATIEVVESLLSSRKLRSLLDKKESQHKTMQFEHSELLPGALQHSTSRNRDYALDYKTSKQLQHEAKARFLIPHSVKSLSRHFLVML